VIISCFDHKTEKTQNQAGRSESKAEQGFAGCMICVVD